MRGVVVAPEAEAQIVDVDAWWRANRSASPELFVQELAGALEAIAASPEAGARYRHPRVPGVRRVLLRATRHHVYYIATEEAVVVLAVWGAIKGAGPRLRRPS